MRFAILANGLLAALLAGPSALAQTPAPDALPSAPSSPAPPPSSNADAGKLVGAPWEFTNADRDKVCEVTFSSARAAQGYRLEFDAACGEKFPLVKDIVGWRFAENDLLRLLDRNGKTLIEFGEVETGVFEAPTPGVGLLFLQAPGSATPPSRPADDMFGEWVMTRSGKPICTFTLDSNAMASGRYPVKLRPGCDAAIVQQNFLGWIMEQGELVMTPSRGAPWRFEEVDAANFRRVPEGTNPITIARP